MKNWNRKWSFNNVKNSPSATVKPFFTSLPDLERLGILFFHIGNSKFKCLKGCIYKTI